MLPYLIAGAIGFVVAKLFEEDETPNFADGGSVGNIIVTNEYEEFDSEVFNELEDEILYGFVVKDENKRIGLISVEDDVIELGIGYILGLEVFEKNKGYGKKIMKKIFEIHTTQHAFGGKATSTSKGFWLNLGAEFDEFDEYSFILSKNKLKYADGGSVLLAPNGKPSNLTPEQYKLVRTPEFKQWFGDWENDPANASKVVDFNGEPLVCYHGSNEVFFEFKNRLFGYRGFYFTDKKSVARSYGSDVRQFFLNSKKFVSEDMKGGNYSDNEWIDDLIINSEMDNTDVHLLNFTDPLDPSSVNRFPVSNIFVIFNKSNIKLADGSNTTFDSNNPDIRFDEGGELADNIFDYLIKEKGFAPLGKGFWGKSNCTIKIDFSNVLYQQNGDNRVWVSPIEYSDYKKAFIILEFHCKDKNKGIGTALLKEIIQGADLFGYTIFIEPTSIKKYRVETDINTNDLKRWYSKYDFKPINDNYSDNVWLRNPNNADIRYADGGSVSELNNYLHNIRLDEWYMENEIMDDDDNIEQYKADFGRKGSIVFRVYPDETGNINSSIYISSIGRGTLDYGEVQSIEGKKDSRGEGAKAIASLFLLYPNINSVHYENESYFESEDKSFWEKIGGDSSELFREDFFRYFENKFGYNPDIRYAGGGKVQPKDLTKINNFNNIQKGVDYYSYSDNLEKQEKADRWFELFVINQKEKQLNKIEFNEFMQLSNELAWEDLD